MGIYDDISTDCTKDIRYTSTENTIGIRDMMSTVWTDYINFNGVLLSYYVHGFDVDDQDSVLYGEHATAPFEDPVDIIGMPEFSSDGMLLAKFGIESTADMSLLISVPAFTEAFTDDDTPTVVPHPKSGDVIEMAEMGWDVMELPSNSDYTYTDPDSGDVVEIDAKTLLCKYLDPTSAGDILLELEDIYGYTYVRYPRMYQITQVRYQDLSMNGVNFMQGHYVWLIEAKRFEYSFESNINPTGTESQTQVADDSFFGALTGTDVVTDTERASSPSLDEQSTDDIWDYDDNDSTDDTVYGGYGYD